MTTRFAPLALAPILVAGLAFGCGSKVGALPTSATVARSPHASSTVQAPQPDASDLAVCGNALGSPNRRLTSFELAYAIEDVFAVDGSALRALPRPHASIGYSPDILVGRLLDTSERFLGPYRKATDGIADRVAARIETDCAGAVPSPEACVVERMREPTQRLFRSTSGPEELAALLPPANTRGPRALAKTLVKGLLDSPRFYLVENEHPAGDVPAARRRLASRLALALHSSVPDLELVRRAESGALEGPGFAEELRRLRADPRFSRLSREFVRQWLRADREPLFRASLARSEVAADPQRLAAFEAQAAAWFGKILAEGRPARDLLDGSSGLLRSGLVLSALSAPIRGGGNENWLGRGILVQEAFLCRTFPLAAVYPSELWDGHPLLDPVRTQTAKRPGEVELLATRTHDKPCRECHRQLETIGAALALGEPASASATAASELGGIADRRLDGPEQVADFVLESGRFEPCLAKKFLTYLLSRAVLPEKRPMDRCLVDAMLAASDSRTLAPVTFIDRVLSSPAFREQGRDVVHDTPNPAPNSQQYRTPLPLDPAPPGACSKFDPGRFLVGNCGTEACHGPGSATSFAVHDRDQARAFLRAAEPSPGGYCQTHPRLIDSANPRQSLIVQKLVAGHEVCGSPMPITGGPHLLGQSDVRCFVQWIEEVAREEQRADSAVADSR